MTNSKSNKIDPTYLRYIYDGLYDKSIHPNNASSLPDGFVGLYDAAFDYNMPVSEVGKIFRIFSLWALLKKEASILFVSQVLCEDEIYIQEFVLKYSKWFNSSEAGKFILYHERLRLYILQRTNNNTVIELHNLICNLGIKQSEYLQLFKLDHHIILSYFDDNKYSLAKAAVLQIEYNQLDTKDYYLAKKRWFKSASILASNFKDYSFLKKLYIKYNDFITPQLSLDDDWDYFLSNGIDFLLDKSQSFFLNQKEAYIYLCYYLHLILHEEGLTKTDTKNLVSLITTLNQMSRSFIGEGDFILNKNYLNYLNQILSKNDLQLLEDDAGLDGFPILMTEDGFGGLFDYGDDRNNKVIYFGGGDREIGKIKNLLIKSFESIDGIPNSPELAKLVIEKIFSLLPDRNIEALESLLQNLRKKVLDSETNSWDNLLEFDSFVFEVFKFVSSVHSGYNFVSWLKLFICSPKLWQQNISFWKMLVDINIEGSLDELYRNYKFGSNEIAKEDQYVIDEIGFVSLVLSLNDRNYEIPVLMKKFFEGSINKSYYIYAFDTLSSSYLKGSIEGKALTLIKDFFYKNDLSSSPKYLKQICELLSEKLNLLDLIDFVYYDFQLQSEVSENYFWSFDVITSIKNKKSTHDFLKYIINGFEVYIKIMGKYTLDEFKNPEDCPSDNKWKIEWWVMCNFYAGVIEVLKNEEREREFFINSIENIFVFNGYYSQINLKEGLDKYSVYRKQGTDNSKYNFEYILHQNQKHQLMNFKNNMNKKEIVSKIAGSIKSGNLNVIN